MIKSVGICHKVQLKHSMVRSRNHDLINHLVSFIILPCSEREYATVKDVCLLLLNVKRGQAKNLSGL